MDIVVNDFSLDGQFADIDSFVESLEAKTFPALEKIRSTGDCLIWNSDTTYHRQITPSLTLYDLWKFMGDPALSKFRSLLVNCTDEPYWESDIKTPPGAIYEFPITCTNAPNALTEALARDSCIFSFDHAQFSSTSLSIVQDDVSFQLSNIFNIPTAGQALYQHGKIGFSQLLLCCQTQKKLQFLQLGNRYCADEGFHDGSDDITTGLSIFCSFSTFLSDIDHETYRSRFSKAITTSRESYFEFRCTINSQEFRIYYIVCGNTFIFLNSLWKKTQHIPEHIKDQTLSLIKKAKSTLCPQGFSL